MSITATPKPTACLALADGTIFTGTGFGAVGETTAELCFNTAMTGYQEIMTDPSYAGQVVTFTFPHIGNTGVTTEDDETAEPVAVIDLDTCMAGVVPTDFGDLVRTCCSPEAEDSTRLEAVEARADVYRELVRGYLAGWGDDLTRDERGSLFQGGLMMCFVVGLRFLTDYLDGDRYFAVSSPGHNLERARNQFRLYSSLLEQAPALEHETS